MGVRVKHGKLFYDFRWRGVRCREFTGLPDSPENRKIVDRKFARIRAEIEDGVFDYAAWFPNGTRIKDFYPERVRPADILVRDYLTGWVARRKPFRPDGSLIQGSGIHATTWYHERNVVEGRLIPVFGSMKLSELANAKREVNEVRRRMLDSGGLNGKGLSAKTVHNVMGVLRKAVNDAIDEDLIERNPVPKTTAAERRHRIYRSNCDPMTIEEVHKILGAMPRRYFLLYRLWFATGMRPGEIVALKPEDFDWSRKKISLERARTPRLGGIEDEPKTGKRIIDLGHDPEVVKLLREHLMKSGMPEYVFPNSKGKPFSQEDLNRDVWHKALKKVGLAPRGEYAIKDTFVTLALGETEDVSWIAQQVGDTVATLLRHYNKYLAKPTRQDGARVAAALWGNHLGTKKGTGTKGT